MTKAKGSHGLQKGCNGGFLLQVTNSPLELVHYGGKVQSGNIEQFVCVPGEKAYTADSTIANDVMKVIQVTIINLRIFAIVQ